MARFANGRSLAVEVLTRVDRDEAYAHIVLYALLDEASYISEVERRLATRIVYGTLAMQRRLDVELSIALDDDVETRTQPFVRACLRAAVYQLRHLDRVPDHAVVDTAVELVKTREGRRAGGFVNAILRKVLRAPAELPIPKRPIKRFAIEHSLPNALARRMIERLGDVEAAQWAVSVNTPSPLCLRVNTHIVDPTELALRLEAQPGRWTHAALRVDGLGDNVRTAMARGDCVVQDEGSQLIGAFCDDPGSVPSVIWDVCAGQGGKTLQLADLARSAGRDVQILATDLNERKLSRLSDALRPSIANLIEVRHCDVLRDDPPIARDSVDLVLVDAPSSGLGLVRRHPETRWRRQTEDIEALATIQHSILQRVAPYVRPGGLLVYAVCTTTLEETHRQVELFLEAHPDFGLAPIETLDSRLEATGGLLELWPHRHDTDGFFAARFRRTTGACT